jgi:uncharacterized protein
VIKQFIPEEFCLKCSGCCRFKEQNSVWSPCLLDEEIQDLLDKKIPKADISVDRKIQPIPNPQGEGFICAFFDIKEDKCKIYELRPFECQLYPFLISLRGDKVYLTVEPSCLYVKERLNTKEFKVYTDYLSGLLNKPSQIRILKDNPQIIQAYTEVLDILELNI